jgi:hypothetical protein
LCCKENETSVNCNNVCFKCCENLLKQSGIFQG